MEDLCSLQVFSVQLWIELRPKCIRERGVSWFTRRLTEKTIMTTDGPEIDRQHLRICRANCSDSPEAACTVPQQQSLPAHCGGHPHGQQGRPPDGPRSRVGQWIQARLDDFTLWFGDCRRSSGKLVHYNWKDKQLKLREKVSSLFSVSSTVLPAKALPTSHLWAIKYRKWLDGIEVIWY